MERHTIPTPPAGDSPEATITPQDNHYQSLRRELDDLEQQIAAKDAEIVRLNSEIVAMNAMAVEQAKEIVALKAKVAGLEAK